MRLPPFQGGFAFAEWGGQLIVFIYIFYKKGNEGDCFGLYYMELNKKEVNNINIKIFITVKYINNFCTLFYTLNYIQI